MTDIDDNLREQSPLRKAFREARAVLGIAIVMGISYNLFAATRIPWIREARQRDSASMAALSMLDTNTTSTPADMGDTSAGGNAPVASTNDTMATAAPDTSGLAALTKHERDSVEKMRRDSLKVAQLDAKRVRDSIAQAQSAGFLEQVASLKEINTDIAKRLYDMKAAIFIDARPEDHYIESHIPGAMNIYETEWQSHIPELVKLPREQLVVTYCGGGDACELSHDLADHLRGIGFKKVVVYTGGIKDWTAKKYPVGTAQK